jgi:dolichyl-phosphate-mannose--protein O-mannosyl transferase
MENLSAKERSAVLEAKSPDSPASAMVRESTAPVPDGNPLEKKSIVARLLRRPGLTALLFCGLGLLIFLPGAGRPSEMHYDEGYYVPEARTFLLWTPNLSTQPPPPLARPPLGKILMAVGMKVAGDNSFGWRVAAAVCGALTLPAVYLWTLLLLGDSRLAAFAAGLTLFNNFQFVMSRVGMMDVFLVFFLIWSLAAYTAALVLDMSAGKRRLLLVSAGILMGFAGASKWNAIDTLAGLILVSFALLWMGRWLPAKCMSGLSLYARNARQIGAVFLLLGLAVAPFTSYITTFWPLCRILHRPFGAHELVAMHRFIWYVSTTNISNPFLTSAWYTWPLNISPQRALSYLIGNPVVTWGGIAAIAYCLRQFWRSVALPEGMVLLLFAANYLQWAVTPEKGLFYYYYYPSVMILGVAVAVALRSLPSKIFGARVTLVLLLIAAMIFLWCYPRMAYLGPPWDCALGCWT